jgi:hypothetical protein
MLVVVHGRTSTHLTRFQVTDMVIAVIKQLSSLLTNRIESAIEEL